MGIYKREGSDVYYARYTDENGKLKRESLGTTDTKEAQSLFAELERRVWLIQRGLLEIHEGPSQKTLQDCYDRALKVYYKDEGRVLEEVGGRWKLLVRLIDPTTAITKIDTVMAEDAKAQLQTLDIPRLNRKYSEATANRVMALLSRLLTLAVEWKWLKFAPRVPITKEIGRERYLTDAEIEAMWRALRESKNPKYLGALDLFITLHQEAMRLREAWEIQWNQVDLEAGTLTLLMSTTKGEKAVTKPLTPEVLEIFKRRKQQGLEWPFADVGSTAYRNAWAYALRKTGLEGQGIVRHTLRHSAATKLIAAGHDVVIVQQYLGHKDIQTTMKYIHADHTMLSGAAKTLGKVCQ